MGAIRKLFLSTCTDIASMHALKPACGTPHTVPKKNHRPMCSNLSSSPAGRPCICNLYQRITRICSALSGLTI